MKKQIVWLVTVAAAVSINLMADDSTNVSKTNSANSASVPAVLNLKNVVSEDGVAIQSKKFQAPVLVVPGVTNITNWVLRGGQPTHNNDLYSDWIMGFQEQVAVVEYVDLFNGTNFSHAVLSSNILKGGEYEHFKLVTNRPIRLLDSTTNK